MKLSKKENNHKNSIIAFSCYCGGCTCVESPSFTSSINSAKTSAYSSNH